MNIIASENRTNKRKNAIILIILFVAVILIVYQFTITYNGYYILNYQNSPYNNPAFAYAEQSQRAQSSVWLSNEYDMYFETTPDEPEKAVGSFVNENGNRIEYEIQFEHPGNDVKVIIGNNVYYAVGFINGDSSEYVLYFNLKNSIMKHIGHHDGRIAFVKV